MTNSWHFRGLDSRSGKLQIFKDCKVCLRTSMLYRSYRRIYHAHTEHFAWQVSGLLFFFFKTLQCAWRTFRVSLHHSGAAWVSDIKHVNYQAARRALRTGKWLLLVVSVTQHPCTSNMTHRRLFRVPCFFSCGWTVGWCDPECPLMEMPPSWFAMVSATRAELLNYNYLRILKTKTFPGAKFCNKFALSCLEFLVKKPAF